MADQLDLAQEPLTDDFSEYFNELNEGTTSEQPEAPAQAAQPETGGGTEAEHIEDDGQQDGQPAEPAAPAEGDDPAKGEPDLDAIKKKAHGYDSMLGRLQAEQQARKQEQQELQRVRDELARTSGRQPAPGQDGHGHAGQDAPRQPQAPQAPQAPLPMAEIPEDIKDEAETFSRDYPDLTPLLRYPGREGEKLRKLLAEYGPDVAAIHGQGVMQQYRMQQTEQAMAHRLSQAEQAAQHAREEAMRQVETDRKQRHYAEISASHPEVQWMADPQKQQDYAQFRHELDEWVMDRPLREAQYIQQVLAQGAAPDVVQVLDLFKQSRTAPQAAPQAGPQTDQQTPNRRNEERDTLASAAAAVPGRRAAVPRAGGTPKSHDFGSAFDEFAKH